MNFKKQDFNLQWHYGSGTVAKKKSFTWVFWCWMSLYSHSQQKVVFHYQLKALLIIYMDHVSQVKMRVLFPKETL